MGIVYPTSSTATRAAFKSSPVKITPALPLVNISSFCQFVVLTVKAKGNEEIAISVKVDGVEVAPTYLPPMAFTAETEVGKEKITNIVFVGLGARSNTVPFFVKPGGEWTASVVKGAPEIFASILTME